MPYPPDDETDGTTGTTEPQFSDEFVHALANLQFHTSHLAHGIRRRYRVPREPMRPGELEITKLLESFLIVKLIATWEAWEVFVAHARRETADVEEVLRAGAPMRAEVEGRLPALRAFRQRWVAHGRQRGSPRPEIPTEVLGRHPFLTDPHEILFLVRCMIELSALSVIRYGLGGADLDGFHERTANVDPAPYTPRFRTPDDLEEPLERLVRPARLALSLDPTLIPVGQPTSVVRRNVEVVESVAGFLRMIDAIRREWKQRWPDFGGRELWFRGHEDADWPLDPPLLREPYVRLTTPYDDHLWRLDHDLCARFRGGALQFLRREPSSVFEWLCVMQQHDVPTRLLAWTESALAGLYFAARRWNMVQDAAVWVLEPRWLGAHLHAESLPVLFNHESHVMAALAGPFDERGPGEQIVDALPHPVMPPVLDEAAIVQNLRFTMHGFRLGRLEEIAIDAAVAEEAYGLRVIRVPYHAKPRILSELHTLGADEQTLFPDAHGLSRRLRMQFGGLAD